MWPEQKVATGRIPTAIVPLYPRKSRFLTSASGTPWRAPIRSPPILKTSLNRSWSHSVGWSEHLVARGVGGVRKRGGLEMRVVVGKWETRRASAVGGRRRTSAASGRSP